jgi:hypothetical protein
MNSKLNFTNNSCKYFNWLLAALALALGVLARAETPAAAIPVSDIGARATANYQGDALGVTATADGARLRCGFQKLEGHATPEGLWLESTKPGGVGRLRLTATALCRESSRARQCALIESPAPETFAPTDVGGYTALTTTGTVQVADRLVRFTRPGLTEEYSVSVDGVRQDFVIAAPPAGAGDLRVELALSGARAEAAAGGAKLRLEGSGRELAYSHLRVEDATGRELTACLEVLSANRLAVSVADANATYPVRIDPTFSDADWVGLGSGMSGSASSLVAVMALAVSGTNLYAGGQFTTAGGVPANNIAKWDGSAWSALGSGMDVDVYVLVANGTNLYAGGDFSMAGANGIAKWNGSAWSALGSGMGGFYRQVNALAVSGTILYAAGPFTTAGGVAANCIAKWDGSAWSALGSGMSGSGPYATVVGALAVSGTNLYAGGYFTTAGGVPANNIAKWDGSAWSPLGSGMSGQVLALAVNGTNLYAAGDFSMAGGVSANHIAKWDGSAWSPLGLGIDNSVFGLAMSGTDLYAGGYFTTVGAFGVPANYIARWDGSAWSALGSGMNGRVDALAADGAGHLFVGGEFSLAGTNVSPCITQANVGSAPAIPMPPPAQTAEEGATVQVAVNATGEPPLAYQWCFNGTNLLSCTNSDLVLTNILFSQTGTYTVVVTNLFGAVTSAPVTLNVIAPVTRRLVPAINLMGQAGNFTGLDYRDNLGPIANWETMATMTLSNASQYCFDVSAPLPPQRFYRAWQAGTPIVMPSLDLHLVPAITLTGNIGDSLRVDYINQFGPIGAWVTLGTVTLTNSSQLYFDTSSIGQPARLWRIVPVP